MTKEDFKQIVLNKLDEINEEYNVIMKNSANKKLDYINIVSAQHNSMRVILEELLKELGD